MSTSIYQLGLCLGKDHSHHRLTFFPLKHAVSATAESVNQTFRRNEYNITHGFFVCIDRCRRSPKPEAQP